MLSTGEADLIAAASLAFLASACPQDDSYGSEEDDQVCLALPVQRKQGFERACCAERTDYTVIKRHLLEAEECASQRVKSLSWSTAAPSSMHASADRFDANGSDAGNHGSDDTITGAQANGGDVQQGGVGDHDHGVGVAGSNDEPRGSGGSDGTARPPSSDAPDDHGVVKAGDDDGGVYQVVGLGSGDGIVGTGGWHAVENDLSQLRSLRTELLQGLALHVRGVHVPSVELRLQVLLCSLKFHTVNVKQLREMQLVQIVRQLGEHTNAAVRQAALQLLQVGSWQELFSLQTRGGDALHS